MKARLIVLIILFSSLTIFVNPARATRPDIPGAPSTIQDFSCSTVTEIPQSECEALVSLYNSTNGSNWLDNSGWLITTTPCSWYRVVCQSGHVTRIILPGNQLNGNIPKELENLSSLQWLRLEHNQLTGSIPQELGNLNNIQHIHLWSNQLSGNIPDSLGGLHQLQDLQLTDNQLNGSIPPELGNLANVQILSLGTNQLTGSIPRELGNLTNLQFLYLGITQIDGNIPPELGSLNSLKDLRLNNTLLSGAIPLSFTGLSLERFYFHNSYLCEPADVAFQSWLESIPDLSSTGEVCPLPTANFFGSPRSGDRSLTVAFTDQSSGDINSYLWDFGDGGNSNLKNPSYTYNSAGTYTVKLTVTGPGGSDTETKTNYISVTEPPAAPTANFFGSPRSGDRPLTVQFTDQSSGSVTSWDWDFGDGGTSSLENPSHTYNTAGSYTVKLTVTGPGGTDTEKKTDYISVNDPTTPPTVQFRDTPDPVKEGIGTATIEVSLSAPSQDEVTVNFSTNDVKNEAEAGKDYTPVTDYQVVFEPGKINQTVKVDIKPDKIDEDNEYLELRLEHPVVNGNLGSPSTVQLTIEDDDPEPTVYFGQTEYNVTEDDGPATIDVKLSHSSEKGVKFLFITVDGVAEAGVDYEATTDEFEFADGEVSKIVTVPIIVDSAPEPDEDFSVLLAKASNASIDYPSSATIMIHDPDPIDCVDSENVGIASLTKTNTVDYDNDASEKSENRRPFGSQTNPENECLQLPFNHFFDDFSYANTKAIEGNGWYFSIGAKTPPTPTKGTYTRSNVTIIGDPLVENGKFIRFLATTEDTEDSMTHSRIQTSGYQFLGGSYAARIFFTDSASDYDDWNVQTFYTYQGIPLSEMDFEYLPNNFWTSHSCGGNVTVPVPADVPVMWMNSWNSTSEEKDCDTLAKPLKGWHHLMFQVDPRSRTVKFFISADDDGKPEKEYISDDIVLSEEYYPNAHMNISLANWLQKPGAANATRFHEMRVDWVYHVEGEILDLFEVHAIVSELRRRGDYFVPLDHKGGSSSIHSQNVQMSAGDTHSAQVEIPAQAMTMNFAVGWEGSTVDSTLVDPDGRLITPAVAEVDAAIDHFKGATFEVYRVNRPASGDWTVQLFGKDLPESGEEVSFDVSVRSESVYLPLLIK